MGEIADPEAKSGNDKPSGRSPGYIYPQKIKDDALGMYVKGHASRHTRRLLVVKYGEDEIPPSRTIRYWFENYSDDIKNAVAKSGQINTLQALYDEERDTEDISDYVMGKMTPIIQEGFDAGEFGKMAFQDKLKIYLKENNDRANLANKKIQRTDPALAQQPPIMAFINFAKQKHAQKEADGTTSDTIIIDVPCDEG